MCFRKLIFASIWKKKTKINESHVVICFFRSTIKLDTINNFLCHSNDAWKYDDNDVIKWTCVAELMTQTFLLLFFFRLLCVKLSLLKARWKFHESESEELLPFVKLILSVNWFSESFFDFIFTVDDSYLLAKRFEKQTSLR